MFRNIINQVNIEFLGRNIKLPTIVCWNNIGAIYLAHNAELSQRTKHIDDYFMKEYIKKGLVKLIFV